MIADIGDALFASTELTTRGRTEFLSPAYYTSMGFAVPAALGAQVARPDSAGRRHRRRRRISDDWHGAFDHRAPQVPAIVIVLDNGGYGTERLLHPGQCKFNEIPPWQYHKLPDVLGGGTGYEVRTEGDFDVALNSRMARHARGPSILHVIIDPNDCEPRPRPHGRANEQDRRAEVVDASHKNTRVPSGEAGPFMRYGRRKLRTD